MCRFVAYKGIELLMADLLIRSENSIISQSLHAKESNKPVNGDGFGIGWYPLHSDPEPGIFTSIEPAWSNHNLVQISKKIRSKCFFAHVRDATPGFPVTQLNCHPFKWGKYMFMHNGALAGFQSHRRPMMATLSDRAYNVIMGSADTEYCFALLLDHLGFKEDANAREMADAVTTTIVALQAIGEKLGIEGSSCLNFAFSDGNNLIATRLRLNNDGAAPETLYHTRTGNAVIVASEPLDTLCHDWEAIKPGSMVVYSADGGFNSMEVA